MKILIFGLPGSGKSTMAKRLSNVFSGSIWINADEIRKHYDDWDFSLEGRIRQSLRMRHLADGVVMAGGIAIADFVCPTKKTREQFDPDFSIWMDTIDKGRFEDTNLMFEKPENPDIVVRKRVNFIDDIVDSIVKKSS